MANRVQRRIGAIAVLIATGSLQGPPREKVHAASYAGLPMSFEANRGQADERVKFISRGFGYTLALTPREALLTLSAQPSVTLRMSLAGGNPNPAMAGVDELAGKVNYFVGDDPAKWRSNIATYRKVKYAEVYPGIDLVYYGNETQLEYDFIVAPAADPRIIRLTFGGADSVIVDPGGALIVRMGAHEVRFDKPVTYQGSGASRRDVTSQYVLLDNQDIGFTIGAYDAGEPLVIDPVLQYATFFGGSNQYVRHTLNDHARALAVDAEGNVYLAGETDSANFPLAGAVQPTFSTHPHHPDAFIAKLNATGTELIYSTYLGGTHIDTADGIAVDASGNAYVTGYTRSIDFPVADALQPEIDGFDDMFVAKLNDTGSVLAFSTYFGGTAGERAHGIAVDTSGNAYVTGTTGSADFPMLNPVQPSFGGGLSDAFVSKFDSTGALVYSTPLGGSSDDEGVDIAVDVEGSAYITGNTSSNDFPVLHPVQGPPNDSSEQVFVAKLNPSGLGLTYSTYLGGSQTDNAGSIAVDSAGSAYVSGASDSPDFPTVNALQSTSAGFFDAFVAKLTADGSALEYSTYIGGSGYEGSSDIIVDAAGNAFVTGYTNSTDFPTANALQPALAGETDAFVLALTASGSAFRYSTYLGGASSEYAEQIAVDAAGSAYVAGSTSSEYFPTASPLQPGMRGGADAFVAKITDAPLPALSSIDISAGTQGTIVSVTLSGLNFVHESSVVTVSGTDVTVGPITVTSPTTMTTTLTIAGSAVPDVRDVTVTTPEGTSNRMPFTIWSATPGCRVSLPVTVYGTPQEASVRVGLGTAEPISGLWLLGVLVPDGDDVKVHGQGIHLGDYPSLNPPLTRWSDLDIEAPVLGVMNAFVLNPEVNAEPCAHTVALTPGVSPSVANRQLREMLRAPGYGAGATAPHMTAASNLRRQNTSQPDVPPEN